MQVVGEIDGDQDSRRRGVDGHRVGRVVEELGSGVPLLKRKKGEVSVSSTGSEVEGEDTNLDIVRIEVSPSELNVTPPLVRSRSVEDVLGVGEERRSRDVPLVGREEKDISGRRVHLVGLSGTGRKGEGNERSAK